MILKTQLRDYLKRRAMTATQLSRLSGVPKQSISDWLAGTPPKNIDQVKKVAEVFQISLDELCFGASPTVDDSANIGLEKLLGEEWVSGFFEVRLRRIKK